MQHLKKFFILSLFPFILLNTPILEARSFTTRDAGMAILGSVNLLFVGLTSWQAAAPLPEEENKKTNIPFNIEGALSYHYLKSPSRVIPRVMGNTNPLIALREGDFIEEGHNESVGLKLNGDLADWFSYHIEPRILFSSKENAGQNNAEFFLNRGYGKFKPRRLEVTLGKENIFWGQGHYASLLFSGHNESFPLIRLGNSEAVELPWFLKYLGPTKIDFFVTFLDANRRFPYSILNGIRTTINPHPRFQTSFAQSVQFGGEGSKTWSPLNYLSDNFPGSGNTQNINRNFLLDMRWSIPKINIEAYTELFWEDCCDTFFFKLRDVSTLLGLHMPPFGPEKNMDLAIEWVRTNSITYHHGSYTSGFFYKGFGMGHPIGADGLGIYTIYNYHPFEKLSTKSTLAYEQRGRLNQTFREDRYRLSLELDYKINRHFKVNWQGGYERLKNFNFVAGNDENNFLIGFGFKIN